MLGIYLDLRCIVKNYLLQGIALLNAVFIVAPPIRHGDSLPATKNQEDQQHVEVEARVERRGEDKVVLRPELVPVAIRPVHDDEAADEPRQVARRHVAVEDGQPAEEDGRVPQMELGARE